MANNGIDKEDLSELNAIFKENVGVFEGNSSNQEAFLKKLQKKNVENS